MKDKADFHTPELPGLPVVKRRGRPPQGSKAMTPAERARLYRLRKKQLIGTDR